MPEPLTKEPRTMPKGGKKGGKRFPQFSLSDVVKWSDKLVSKTHGTPQPEDLIKASVVEAKSGVGDMRISALKQFDLMEGTSKGYTATELAKELRSTPVEEKRQLHQRAALKPDIFRAIYETYHGDVVPFAKIKQRAADLQVHPDSAVKCAEIYTETMEFAGLLTRDGDTLTHVGKDRSPQPDAEVEDGPGDSREGEVESASDDKVDVEEVDEKPSLTRRGVATVQVSINLDSTLDTDKLQKQLELLRKFGAL